VANVHREQRTSQKELLVDETIFSIANGYIGTRGTFTEGYGSNSEYHQTYLNGFYDYYDYHYEENLTGFPQQGQKFVNLLDGTKIEFYIEGTPLNMSTSTVKSLVRDYNLEKGYTKRVIQYQLNGFDFILTEIRIVPNQHKFVISIDVTLESPNYTGLIQVKSYLKPSQKSNQKSLDPRVHNSSSNHLIVEEWNPKTNSAICKTVQSGLYVQSIMLHNVNMTSQLDQNQLVASTQLHIATEEPLHITKHIIHTSSLYDDSYKQIGTELSHKFSEFSFLELLKTEEETSTLFWDNSKIEIENNQELNTLLQYSMFQLNRQGGEHYTHNISAKGLSGEGYEGHYFWDTEIYMIPYFTLTNPTKAKNLLLYRYHKMKEAKQEAINLGYQHGIKIPWRTINGMETSPYYPAGSAQFHINSDVAYAIIKYIEATNDIEFLIQYGFELLVETARFLKEAVNYKDGVYHLNSVTGPDEYTTVVDDNFYTNVMLQYHFQNCVTYYRVYRDELDKVVKKLELTEAEMNDIYDIAMKIHLPYDETLGIFIQDRNFLQKKQLDIRSIPREKFPLLLHFHPLYLYKHQVLKQADTMLALLLLDRFNKDIVERSFAYYEPITTHDSSLSKCIYSIIAFQLNQVEVASNYFRRVLETDINDIHNNTKDGLHVANLGGSYMGFVYGLVGLRIHKDYITLYPRVTNEINRYKIQFMYHGITVAVAVNDKLTVTTTGSVSLKLYDEVIEVNGTYQTVITN